MRLKTILYLKDIIKMLDEKGFTDDNLNNSGRIGDKIASIDTNIISC